MYEPGSYSSQLSVTIPANGSAGMTADKEKRESAFHFPLVRWWLVGEGGGGGGGEVTATLFCYRE